MKLSGKRRYSAAAGVTAAVAAVAAVGATLTSYTAAADAKSSRPSGSAVYLAASLNGFNEVPKPGGPKVGDKKGHAVEFLRIQGNRVSFAVRWSGIGAPTEGHIHLGARGANGPVEIQLFGQKLPASLDAVAGSVTVKDPALLRSLRQHPSGFYANLHTAAFPGGAVRGQLYRIDADDYSKALTG